MDGGVVIPNIKDQSTVDLIANLFCGACNRNKTQTLVKAGYTHGYADGLGQRRVFGNNRVRQAIAKIDSSIKAVSIFTRKQRQEFWTTVMTDPKANLADRLRSSELLGRSEADFTDNIQRTNKTLAINVVKRIGDKE